MWKTVKLGEVYDILDKLRKPNRVEGDYPYYGATGIVDWVADYIFDESLVLIGEDVAKWEAGAQTAFIAEGKYWVNNHAHVVKPHVDKLLNEWLAYCLTGIDLKPWVTGLTVPKLNQAQLKSIPIPLPPLAEQQRIIAKLDAAIAKIDTAIAAAEKKESHITSPKNALLREELAGDGWNAMTLNDACEIQPQKKEVKQNFIEETEVTFMGMDLLGINKMYAKSNDVRSLASVYKSYTYFSENDVLLAKITPCFENGKLGIARGLKNRVGFGSSEFIVFRCKKYLYPKFLYYFLNQNSFREEGKRNMSGAVGHKRVTKDFIANLFIALPPIAEQQRIIAKLNNAFERLDSARSLVSEKKQNYQALKSSLLAAELTRISEAA